MSIDTIASRLGRANDFVEVATEVCRLTSDLGVHQCAVSLHAPDGRPIFAVDNLAKLPDEPRLQWLTVGWERDPLHRALSEFYAPVGDEAIGQKRFATHEGYTGDVVYTLLLPLIYPGGLLGQIRCGDKRPFDASLRRDLTTVAISVSVRLTELRVTPQISPLVVKLTARQRDVARLAAQGLSNIEIGKVLQLSPNTVKKHLKDVFESLEVASRVQLAAVVGRSGPVHDYPLGVTRVEGITIVRVAG
ncbi:MAG TPA: LuxR C-terminal-related transcriptional regulator [Kofleriaceae bacterium]|nr:LuxR C-terminal-related transcriptional regulator [Kofleriaceae bacterium]